MKLYKPLVVAFYSLLGIVVFGIAESPSTFYSNVIKSLVYLFAILVISLLVVATYRKKCTGWFMYETMIVLWLSHTFISLRKSAQPFSQVTQEPFFLLVDYLLIGFVFLLLIKTSPGTDYSLVILERQTVGPAIKKSLAVSGYQMSMLFFYGLTGLLWLIALAGKTSWLLVFIEKMAVVVIIGLLVLVSEYYLQNKVSLAFLGYQLLFSYLGWRIIVLGLRGVIYPEQATEAINLLSLYYILGTLLVLMLKQSSGRWKFGVYK